MKAKQGETGGRVATGNSAVLVLAPNGNDAEVIAAALNQASIGVHVCTDLADLAQRFGEETNALLLAEEGLVSRQLPLLLEQLQRQPAWSDIPVIILTAPSGDDRTSASALDTLGPTANVTLLERPLRPVTLVAAAKV